MQVQVINRLATILVAVDHAAIALFGKSLRLRVSGRGEDQLADQQGVGFIEVVERGHGFARNEQDMRGRLAVDVAEGKDIVILVDDVGRNLAADDLLKNGVAHGILPCDD